MPDREIASLTAGSAPDGTEIFHGVQGGNSRKFTGAQLTALAADPATDDGDTLGTASRRWSDLFLASGGVVNWANGNVTVTHAAGELTFSGPINIGNADTTLAREAAGQVTVEGSRVYTAKADQWSGLTEKTTLADADLFLIEDSAASGAKKKVQKSNVGMAAADQAAMETASSTSVAVTPGRQKFHPSAAKAWLRWNMTGTPAIAASYNVSSIADNGTGDQTVNFTTAFSSANYGISVTGNRTPGVNEHRLSVDATNAPMASACRFRCIAESTNTESDGTLVGASFFGDQ